MREREAIELELGKWALWDALKVALYIAQATGRKDVCDKILRILVKL